MKNYVYSRIYKLCCAFSWLIVFFIGGIFCTMTCHAQSLPVPSVNTINTITDGNGNIFRSGFSSQGTLPLYISNSQLTTMFKTVANNPVLTDASLFSVDSSDFEVRSLTQEEIDLYSQVYSQLYTATNDVVTWDNTYYVTYDNGYFSGQLYCDSNGNILSFKPDNNTTFLAYTLGFGGSVFDASDFGNIYDQIGELLSQQQFYWSEDDSLNFSDTLFNYYIAVGQKYNYSDTVKGYKAWKVNIPNIYDLNHCYIYSYTNNNNGIVSNSPTVIYFVENPSKYIEVIADYQSRFVNYQVRVNTINTTVNNITYNYQLIIDSSLIQQSKKTSYADFASQNGTASTYIMGYNGFSYNPDLASTNYVYNFQYTDDSYFDVDDSYYSYDSLQNLNDKLNTANWALNDSFNPEQTISDTNYPYYIDTVIDEVIPTSLPFPDTITSNPPIVLNPDIVYEQSLQPEMSVAIDSFQNMGIPFIQGISNRYPFSIPWDIANFVSRFNATPTPPAWNFDWKITIGSTTYTKHFEGDLSDFNSLAEIFRNLILISFVIALCKFSYDHHF